MKNGFFGVYVILDLKSEEYGVPFVAPNDVLAKRSICTELLGVSDVIISDLRLLEIAQYNSETAMIESYHGDTIDKPNFYTVADGDDLLNEVCAYRDIIRTAKNEVEKENKK